MPTLFMLGAVLAWVIVVMVVFAPSSRVRWPWAVVGVLVVISSSNATYFNLTNVQWVTALLWAFWWGAEEPRSKIGLVGQLVGIGLVGLTGVFAILVALLMEGKALVRRTWASSSSAVVCAVVAWVQWGAVRATPGGATGAGMSPDWGMALLVQGKRVWGTLFCTGRGRGGGDVVVGPWNCRVPAGGDGGSGVAGGVGGEDSGGWRFGLWRRRCFGFRRI
ncbi:MAG: hypothetical protein J6386_18255 [Candidatus Synoicihabitans palmerolidicus]|nr:hypothetical protein [Candidatus Synoicihabitans palmerolidicus]